MKLFKRARLNSKGFAHVEIVILVIVIVAVATAGYLVYKHDHKNTNNTAASSVSSSKSTSRKSTAFVSNTPTHPPGIKLPEASANNWSYVAQMGNGTAKAYACKTYIPVYGGVYKIQALFIKPANWVEQYYISGLQGGGNYINKVASNQWWYGVVAELTTYYSLPEAHSSPVIIGLSGLYGSDEWEGNPAYLVNC